MTDSQIDKPSETQPEAQTHDHYLKTELYELVRKDPSVFEFLQAGSLDGIWFWDLVEPEHEWMSARFWETLGYDPAERAHRAAEWQDLIHPQDLKVALKNFERHCAAEAHPYDQYVRYRHAQGHWTWVRCRGLAIRDDAGTPTRMLGVHVDVTELKQSEARERALRDEAERVNKDLALFAYAASHDLQSPIKSLKGLVDLLKYEVHDDGRPSEQTIEHIERSIDRLQRLVDSVLFLSRDDEPADTADVDIGPLVHRLIEELSGSLPDRGRIECHASGRLRANPALLERALRNCLVNSIEHRSPERPVRVSVSQHLSDDARRDVLRVEDNGIGVEPDRLESVFELFSRDHGSGHGLGLAIVRRIMRYHGGEVIARAQPEGVAFDLSFPRGD